MTPVAPETETGCPDRAPRFPGPDEELNVTDSTRPSPQARFAQGDCPVCGDMMHIARLECDNCGTAMEGHFLLNSLSRLSMDHLDFLESFIRNRGVIKDIEVDLGISYPTVKSRLEEVIKSLGYSTAEDRLRPSQVREERRTILEQLRTKKISSEEAARKLMNLGERSTR